MMQNLTEKLNWIPITEIQKFFNYKPTQMAALLKEESLIVAKIGKRKFIYLPSVAKFLEEKAKP